MLNVCRLNFVGRGRKKRFEIQILNKKCKGRSSTSARGHSQPITAKTGHRLVRLDLVSSDSGSVAEVSDPPLRALGGRVWGR